MSVAECKNWAVHCKATPDSHDWVRQREEHRARRQREAADAAAKANGSGGSGGLPSTDSPAAPRWSCDEILAAVQQVYPHEQGEPQGLLPSVVLRPYQKQARSAQARP